MNRRTFLKAIGAFAAVPAFGRAAEPPPPANPWRTPATGRRPNIILVLCDDLGWGDLGAFWQNRRDAVNRILTPHLDRAVAEGVKLTDHLTVAPVCAPARASMMTGKHQGHCNMRDNGFDHAIDPHMTLGTVMKAGGYATWHIGKWGIGGGYQSKTPRTAMACQSGFDYSYGYPAHLHGHSYYHCFIEGVTDIDSATKQSPVLESYSEAAYEAAGRPAGFVCDRQPGAKTGQWRRPAADREVRFVYDTDLFTAKAKQLIRTHLDGSDRAAPFFLQLCYTTVHGSGNRQVADPAIRNTQVFQVPGGPYPALSDDPSWGGGATLEGSVKSTADAANTWIHPDFRDYATPSQRRYATTVRRLDDAIGDLLHYLRLRGLEEDTLFVFTSDNGPAGEYLQPAGLKWVETMDSNGPFKGMKRWSYEGGLREPTFVRWPGTVPAGKVSDFPCNFPCWMPTFAEAAGLPPPAHSDGVSLLPELVGTGRQLPCRLYTEYSDGGSGRGFGLEQSVRQDNRVLVRNSNRNGGAPELYDIMKDPGQEHDLAAAEPETVARLLPLLSACRIPVAKVKDACGAPTFYSDGGKARAALDAEPLAALPAGVPVPEAAAWIYQGRWPWVPDFRALMPVHQVPAGRISAVLARLPKTGVGAMVHGVLTLPEAREVVFAAKGDGGCQVWVHEAHILEYEAGDCAGGRRITLRLAKGRHPWRACLTAPLVALTADGLPLV